MNGRSGFRLGKGRLPGRSGPIGGNGTYEEFFVPYGLVSPGQMWAMLARRHMYEYGTTQEQLGAIALACRARANVNPNAQMRGRPLAMDDYRSSPMISSPLRLLDYCLETDGACAVVITDHRSAADRPKNPVLISAVTQAVIPDMQGGLASPASCAPTRCCCRPPRSPPSCTSAPAWVRRISTSRSSTTASPSPCLSSSKTTDSASPAKAGRSPIAARSTRRFAADQHVRGQPFRRLYPRHQPHRRRRPPAPGESTSQVAGAETCLVTSGLPITTSGMILRKG